MTILLDNWQYIYNNHKNWRKKYQLGVITGYNRKLVLNHESHYISHRIVHWIKDYIGYRYLSLFEYTKFGLSNSVLFMKYATTFHNQQGYRNQSGPCVVMWYGCLKNNRHKNPWNLALNNQQWLICNKTKPTYDKNTWNYITVSKLFVLNRNSWKYIIMSYRLHGYPWPSLATSPYHSSPLPGLQDYIPYPHIAAVRAGRPAFARPYAGVHRSTSFMSWSLLLHVSHLY